MDHARDALTTAYREQQEKHPVALSNQDIRRIFRVVLIAISHDEDQVAKNWDDVQGIVREAVDAHLSADMQKIKGAVTQVLLDVVKTAQRNTPVYVTPPPYQ